jgi:hypothetical protein
MRVGSAGLLLAVILMIWVSLDIGFALLGPSLVVVLAGTYKHYRDKRNARRPSM